jgi:prepilin-type N-terminal cleavage/methylation domain-containing protein
MKNNLHKTGFTLVETMIVVGIIGLLAAIAIPSMKKARATSQANGCINNLKQIEAAMNQFSMDHALPSGTSLSYPNDLTPYLKLNTAGSIPGCPARGTYTLDYVGDFPTCSLGTTVTPNHVLP